MPQAMANLALRGEGEKKDSYLLRDRGKNGGKPVDKKAGKGVRREEAGRES